MAEFSRYGYPRYQWPLRDAVRLLRRVRVMGLVAVFRVGENLAGFASARVSGVTMRFVLDFDGERFPAARGAFERLDETDRALGTLVDDMHDVMGVLRQEKNYAASDRMRTLTGRAARIRRRDVSEGENLVRSIARDYK